MPVTKSAAGALRKSFRRRIKNLRWKKELRDVLKKVRKAIQAKNKEEFLKFSPQVYKTLDKMAKIGVIKKNAASRKKSRLAKLANKVFSSKI